MLNFEGYELWCGRERGGLPCLPGPISARAQYAFSQFHQLNLSYVNALLFPQAL